VDIVMEHVGAQPGMKAVRSLNPPHPGDLRRNNGFDAKVDLRFLFSRQLSLAGSYMGTMNELHEVMKHSSAET